ncbi:MarR family transcriptional regulator [bacterium]|nr:MarR family transcriptional regulator [bacterium]
MPRKEFVRLMEENIIALDRLADKMRLSPSQLSGRPRQQMVVLVRLHGRPARLKDIARREGITAPSLCATFRRLERDGLVMRTVDESDRRNTWYRCTPAGDELAQVALNNFRVSIDRMFSGISRDDEQKLTAALKTMNGVLKNMESQNAKI